MTKKEKKEKKMKTTICTEKEPELDQSKHPYSILGEEDWNRLSRDGRFNLYFEWVRPQREYWENRGYKPLFSSFGDASKITKGKK